MIVSQKGIGLLLVGFFVGLGVCSPWLWSCNNNNLLAQTQEALLGELRDSLKSEIYHMINNHSTHTNSKPSGGDSSSISSSVAAAAAGGQETVPTTTATTTQVVETTLAASPNLDSSITPSIESTEACIFPDLQNVQLDAGSCWTPNSNIDWGNVRQLALNLGSEPCYFHKDYSIAGCGLQITVKNLKEIFPAQQHSYFITSCDTSTGFQHSRVAFINITGNVAVQSNGNGVIFGGKYVFQETLDQYTYRDRQNLGAPNGGMLSPAGLPEGTEKLIMALSTWGGTWQHLLQDQLDIIGFFWEELERDPSLKILLDEGDANAHSRAELISLLGLESRIFTPNHRHDNFYPVKSLYYLDKDPRIPGTKPYGVQRARTLARKNLKCDPNAPRDLFVMYTRPVGNSRTLGNQGETQEVLTQWVQSAFGGKVQVKAFNPGDVSLAESLSYSCRAIGALHPHGGCLYHTLTMPSNSVVIELIPREGMCTTGSLYNRALGHEFFQVEAAGHRDMGVLTANMDFLRVAFADVEKYLKENGLP